MKFIPQYIKVKLKKIEPFKVILYKDWQRIKYGEFNYGNSIEQKLFNTDELQKIALHETPDKITILNKEGKFIMRFNESQILQ